TFRVILFSIHSDEWKSIQSQHQTAMSYVTCEILNESSLCQLDIDFGLVHELTTQSEDSNYLIHSYRVAALRCSGSDNGVTNSFQRSQDSRPHAQATKIYSR
nr:hypothetical protein [Tanacetum cinerariifolium]